MNSELLAAIFLASFSFSRSAAQPRAITLTWNKHIINQVTAHMQHLKLAIIDSAVCKNQQVCIAGGHSEHVTWSEYREDAPAGPSWHRGWP